MTEYTNNSQWNIDKFLYLKSYILTCCQFDYALLVIYLQLQLLTMLNSQIGGDLILQILAKKKSNTSGYKYIQTLFIFQGCKNNKLYRKNHTLEKFLNFSKVF